MSIVRRLNELRLQGGSNVSVDGIRKYLNENFGFKPTTSAVWEHIRTCLRDERAK